MTCERGIKTQVGMQVILNMSDDIPEADDISIPSSVESDKENELRGVLETLRELQHDKADKASEATSAQSKKYNQGAAFAYAISANTIEGVLDNE